ncbi:hypothetical protein ACH5BF_04720 [Arcobacter sp. YIC-464]|uniref:hypothetical protein n=1 Tax=Arcobacter sp. YIC-464 TaxID=3376631 RepID=UPI003C1C6D2E
MCNVIDCGLDEYENGKCILHCEKDNNIKKCSYSEINEFWIAIEEIISKFNNKKYDSYIFKGINFPDFKYTNGKFIYQTNEDEFIEIFSNIQYDKPIIFDNCTFQDEVFISKKCKANYVCFKNNCIFYTSKIHIDKKVKFLGKCKFKKNFNITCDFNSVDFTYIFHNCIFTKKVYIYGSTEKDLIISSKLFNECFFLDNIGISNIVVNSKSLFRKCHFEHAKTLNINDAEIHSSLNIRDFSNFNEVKITNSTFLNIFKLKQDTLSKLYISNCIFEKEVEILIYNIKSLNILNGSFYETFIIDFSEVNILKFKNNYFKNIIFSNRNLDTNIDFVSCVFVSSNFHNANLESNIANRETARIIKDSFEQQNNIIEANKFYAIEMQKREEELDKEKRNGKNFFDWLIFKVHGLASNHSQDSLLALFWILIFSFTYGFINCLNESLDTKLEYLLVDSFIIGIILLISIWVVKKENINNFYLVLCFYIFYSFFSKDFTLYNISNNINPFSIMTGLEELSFLTLLYKISIAFLIYQFIISIRQNTRRK